MRLLLFASVFSLVSWGAEGWRTGAPTVCIIDYKRDHAGSAEYLRTIAAALPQLLHAGEDVPFSSGYGTKESCAGNKSKLLTAGEACAKAAHFAEYAASLRRAGVRFSLPTGAVTTVRASLTFSQEGGNLTFAIPEVKTYAILETDIARR